jgi:hypothetical protein
MPPPVSSPVTGRAAADPPGGLITPDQVEHIPWSVLGPEFLTAWGRPTRGGQVVVEPEAVEIIGQNGSGKSWFERTILLGRARTRHAYTVIIATKQADATLSGMGWPIISHWPPGYTQQQVIFWAKRRGIGKAGRAVQRDKVLQVLTALWKPDSNVVLAIDEITYLCKDLGLMVEMETYYREARSLGITIVASTQRGAGVTRWMHSESKWTVCFAPKDQMDAERTAEILGNRKQFVPILASLDKGKYEFLILHNLSGQMYVSWIDVQEPARTYPR